MTSNVACFLLISSTLQDNIVIHNTKQDLRLYIIEKEKMILHEGYS